MHRARYLYLVRRHVTWCSVHGTSTYATKGTRMAHYLPQMPQGVTHLSSQFHWSNHSVRMNIVKMFGSDSHFGLMNMAEHNTEQASAERFHCQLIVGRFLLRSRRWLAQFRLQFSWFPHSSQLNAGKYLKLGHDLFLPSHFQFTVTHSFDVLYWLHCLIIIIIITN
jgi:hypothetical protein